MRGSMTGSGGGDDGLACHHSQKRPGAQGVGLLLAIAILLLLLFNLRRAGERTGRLAERLETSEKANDAQRRILKAAAARPRDRDDLVERLRDGGF